MSGPPAVRLTGVVKRFGPVVANAGADLDVASGEIHALVGENGAGKSTLMRVLAGMYPPDGGTVEVAAGGGALRDVSGWTTREAIDAGVGMVHQHFMLVPTLTVAENLILGREPKKGLSLDLAAAERGVRALCERTGLRVDPSRLVSDLSVGEAQRVEILKTLYRGAKVLILDEPTAVLSPPEIRELWKVLRRLREDGGTVVLITHKLDEVIEISETITVMRAGRTVGRMATAEATARAIARMMVGRDVSLAIDGVAVGRESGIGNRESDQPREAPIRDSRFPIPDTVPGSRFPVPGDAAAMVVSHLTVASPRKLNEVDDISFTVARGEILGIAGVEGNGQTELIEAITGLREVSSGTISIVDSSGSLRDITDDDVRARADTGLSHIPEDRHRRGLVLEYSVADNLILGQQHRFTGSAGTLDHGRIAANAASRIGTFDIRPPDESLPSRALSGGNQQKIVIAREMGRDFTVLIAAQPTRGVDVGAIEFIHEQLRKARAQGKAILLISADLIEILALSDRVTVMYGGRMVVTLPARDASAGTLGPYMTGAQGKEGSAT
ncbi:MAG TPA: ABC transporter ATP-binding protein [Gemmatimonadaceae bacterium]|nr:ABC transporter ATP-binding protein [Gemmatimonadaceae bacterium]